MDFADLNYYLDVNGLSKHLGVAEGLPQNFKYNESNPGLGITAESVNNRLIKALMAGRYQNSFGTPSYYAGGSLAKRFGNDYYIDLGVFGGAATGYKDVKGHHNGNTYSFPEYKAIQPMAGLMTNIGTKDLGRLGIKYIPKSRVSPALLMMNLGIPF